MRRVLPLLILIAGCSAKPDDAGPPSGSFSGAGRDRLCIANREGGVRAGIITYGAGDSNCSVTGTLARAGAGWQLTPQGDRLRRQLPDSIVQADRSHAAFLSEGSPQRHRDGTEGHGGESFRIRFALWSSVHPL